MDLIHEQVFGQRSSFQLYSEVRGYPVDESPFSTDDTGKAALSGRPDELNRFPP